MAVAPAEHAPAAKAAVSTEDDLHLRPDLAEAFDQQGQNRPGMQRRVDVGGPQVGGEQLIPAEDIQRQEAILFVVSVVEPPFLLAVDGIIGGVKIED